MSQTYTADPYAGGTVVATTMTAVNNNFAALKSAFSGATTPANTVAGQWWYDTTAHILKVRNEANNAWQSVWDLANNKPVITNLSAEITGAMIAAAIKDAAAGTASLRTLGTGAAQACAGNDARLSDARAPADASVSQAKLKTSTSTTSSSHESGAPGWSLLTGGEYGFTPQAKGNDANMNFVYGIDKGTLGGDGDMQSASYVGPMIQWEWARTDQATNHTFYLQQRYVTSSGEINWLFVLRDKVTKKIIMGNYSSEHPCFGQGGDPEAMPHPWVMGKPKYDPDIHEVLVANPTDEMVMQILEEHPEYDSFLEAIHEGVVEIDELSRPAWPKKEVTVGLPKGTDWKRMPDGTPVTPIKKVIPRPEGLLVRGLKRRT